LKADHLPTRRQALHSLAYHSDISSEAKRALALEAELGEDPESADTLFSLFSSSVSAGVDPDDLSDEELCKLVEKLRRVKRLDKHYIQEFLKIASKRVPESVFNLLMDRLGRETSEEYPEYKAVPYSLLEEHVGFGESLQGLSESQNYLSMLRQARDLMTDEDRPPSAPDVFIAVSNGLNDAGQKVLLEWLEDCNPERLRAILKLIDAAPESFVLENADFVDPLLKVANDMGEEHFDYARSRLLRAPMSGSRTRGPYQPAPEDARNRDRGRELAEEHRSNPLLQDFYTELANAAEERIDEDIRRDEEAEI